ncbi:hypothetical protein DAPPUDRAFT_264621 [Daphnia pulex]|uniref:Uncharacterized protein n=1 Tax=Daphnia pulex TaxID=6669 RepID=E9HRZ2_DAPPU|nr:hypothetical protein DAPPUDRAFT_264621 [Daphnia pulex]|eukprot:EFX65465.1 hypothetical protein DAPPUDRAFT_264621 [Daphnia pulex]
MTSYSSRSPRRRRYSSINHCRKINSFKHLRSLLLVVAFVYSRIMRVSPHHVEAIEQLLLINDIIADGTTTRPPKIHELQNKIANLEAKMATVEGLDKAIQEELDPADVEIEIEADDISNQTLRDAKDCF